MQPDFTNKYQPGLRWPAQFISYLLHPVFVPLYAVAFLLYLHPSYFSGFSEKGKLQVMLIITLNAVFFPLLAIVLLKGLGFINSIYLRTKKDRIVPYIICNIFFFWTYNVFRQQDVYPTIVSSFWLGIFFASSAALMANIYFKISMHSLGMGGWLGLFLIIFRANNMLMTWPLALVIMLCGLVATARFLVSDHTEKEIYAGFFVGIASQFMSAYILL